ncbi:hypothetical protein SAMN05444369_10589 [Capnocytophaga haemolytica]|uniref:Uncharacterized protein n=1 Tax=Capnocytophaga haemolytica TaxID=45243 RepID=A0AAX2H0N4_9FLAO|nr:hypothetical protein SAMN05444369_10589 [Capnocytophaga haemolytica]SNV12535.1 Uncharacterised protein [Capnocytophaga haemolytica]
MSKTLWISAIVTERDYKDSIIFYLIEKTKILLHNSSMYFYSCEHIVTYNRE